MDLIRESLGITIVFLLLWGALWLLKKKGIVGMRAMANRSSDTPCLQVVDKIRLTPQHSVHVVSVEGRRMVVGVHPSGFTLLEPAPATIARAAGDSR